MKVHGPIKTLTPRSLSLLCSLAALLLLLTACRETPAATGDTVEGLAPGLYVMAGRDSGGANSEDTADGSEGRPFFSLAQAEAASGPGDILYLIPGEGGAVLDGGITLKANQKLIGLGADGLLNTSQSKVRLTNTTGNNGGVIVELSSGNEVAGIHFIDLSGHAIHGSGPGLSGTSIHHTVFSGAAESEEILWSIFLETATGAIENVTITDSQFRDGEDLGGIQLLHQGDSSGKYKFARNDFNRLGGRAYHLWSQGTSQIETEILDSTADNIGLGDRNSDSILPHLWNSSQQTVTVRNFRYNNSSQVGSPSNTGTEAFLMGAPFPDTANYCDGCKLTLEIADSVYESPVTDGIQLINLGSNSILDVRIRNTKIIDAKPQQVGGGLSLLSQNAENSGNQSLLLVENSEIVGSSQYGFVLSDVGDGFTSIVDLGGGELGSAGNNRIVGSAAGEVKVINGKPVAKHNWWGPKKPRIELEGESSSLEWQPVLETDPAP